MLSTISNFFNHPVSKNIRAVLIGCVLGGFINGLIVKYGAAIIPYPEGYDHSTTENFKATIHLLQPINYIVPFLAHAVGTLIGCIIVYFRAYSHHLKLALFVAGLFFIGGLMMVFMVDAFMWFNILDLVFAYFPMVWMSKFIHAKMTS